MATELAQAYVQIIPSAKGIKGQITSQLSGESQAAGSSSGSLLGGNLVGTLLKVVAAAGIGKAIASSISAGGDLQQSIGGIETLFKDSSDEVVKNADNAYKTAGLSANDYMETATGFAASLLQSVGGDTQAASKMTDMAITDMSDNANKMGTDMSAIQYAYQGFAKQNYTMLDNLKLGYGGTKTEMQRLLADAQKITGVKYDMNNLSDVYSAIHVIQGQLDITGTTAKEAASTLSGSMASMKSAFQNLLGNLSLGKDIGPSLQALGDTVSTFLFQNLFPMIGNILSQLPTLLSGLSSIIIGSLNMITNNAPQIIQVGIQLVQGLVTGLVSALPYLLEAAGSLISALWNALITTDWGAVGSSILTDLKDSMDLAAGEIFGVDTGIVDAVKNAITVGLPNLLQAGIDMSKNISDGMTQNGPSVIASATDIITGFIQTVFTALPQIVDAGFQIIGNLGVGLLNNLPYIIESIGTIITSILQGLLSSLPQILESGFNMISQLAQGLINNLPAIVESIAKLIAGLLAAILTHLPEILEAGIKIVGQLVVGIIQAIPKIVEAIPKITSQIKESFSQYDWGAIGNNIISGIGRGISSAAGEIASAARDAAERALNSAKRALGIQSPSKVMKEQVGKQISAGIALGIRENTDPIQDAMSDISDYTTGTLQSELNVGVNSGSASAKTAAASSNVFNFTINGSEGQSVNDIADAVMFKMQAAVNSRKAVFA